MSIRVTSLNDTIFQPGCCVTKSGQILAKKPWFEAANDDPFVVTMAALEYLNAAQTDTSVSLKCLKSLSERASSLAQDHFFSDLERARFSAVASQASLLFWIHHPKTTAKAKQLYKDAMQANVDRFYTEYADPNIRLQKAQEHLRSDPMKAANVKACIDAMIKAGATETEVNIFFDAVFTDAFHAFCTEFQIDEFSKHTDPFTYKLKCNQGFDFCKDSRKAMKANLLKSFESNTKLVCFLRSLSDLATEYVPNAPRSLLLKALFLEAYNFVYRKKGKKQKALNAFQIAAKCPNATLASTFAEAKVKQRTIDPMQFNEYSKRYDNLADLVSRNAEREDVNPLNIGKILIAWSLDRYNPEYYAESGSKSDLFRWFSAPYHVD